MQEEMEELSMRHVTLFRFICMQLGLEHWRIHTAVVGPGSLLADGHSQTQWTHDACNAILSSRYRCIGDLFIQLMASRIYSSINQQLYTLVGHSPGRGAQPNSSQRVHPRWEMQPSAARA